MATTDHSHPASHGTPGGQPHDRPNGLNHETTDVSLKGVTRIAILSFAMLLVVYAIVFGFWTFFASQARDTRPLSAISGRTVGKDRLPAGPLVLTDEPGALRQLRAEEEQILEHYAWVDKNQGTVRLPIARAMELLVEQPARIAAPGDGPPPAAAPAATPPAPEGAPATPPASPTVPPPATPPGHE